MGIFSGSKIGIDLTIDTGAAAFLKPRAAGQGQSLAKWIEALVYREIATLADAEIGTSGRLGHAERASMLALLLHVNDRVQRLDINRVPWVGRVWLAQRTGLSKVAIGQAVTKLEEAGDLISKVDVPQPGRRGPLPMVYTLTPKGAQAAFHLDAETEESLRAISTWEDLIGYPGKGSKPEGEPQPVTALSGHSHRVDVGSKLDEYLTAQATEPALCVCGHSKDVHDNGLNDAECGQCGCQVFEAPGE